MKQFIKTTLLILLLAFQSIYAQNTTETELIGTWTIDYNETLKNIHKQGEKTYETMDTRVRNRIVQAYKGRQLTLSENARFNLTLVDGRRASGTWSISGNKLFMTSSKGAEYDYQIHKLTSTILVLKTKEYGKTKPIFKYRHYTKN